MAGMWKWFPSGNHCQSILGGSGSVLSTGVTKFVLKDADFNAITLALGDRVVVDGFVINADSTAGNTYEVTLFTDNDGDGAISTGDSIHWRGVVTAQYGQTAGIVPCRFVGGRSDGAQKGKLCLSVVAVGSASATTTDLAITMFGQVANF